MTPWITVLILTALSLFALVAASILLGRKKYMASAIIFVILLMLIAGTVFFAINNILPTITGESGPAKTEKLTEGKDSHTTFGACDSVNKDPSITALKNNGQVVPNAYMFLDKNETQVASGDYWYIEVPANVYGQVFYPMSGLTYQVRGPALLRVSAATFWCDNGGSTPHDSQYQMIDAKKLDAKYLDANYELAGEVTIGDWVTVPGVTDQPK